MSEPERVSWREAPGPQSTRGSILVVDDDPECTKALTQIFTTEKHPPDAVVTDVEMPKMDGLTLL